MIVNRAELSTDGFKHESKIVFGYVWLSPCAYLQNKTYAKSLERFLAKTRNSALNNFTLTFIGSSIVLFFSFFPSSLFYRLLANRVEFFVFSSSSKILRPRKYNTVPVNILRVTILWNDVLCTFVVSVILRASVQRPRVRDYVSRWSRKVRGRRQYPRNQPELLELSKRIISRFLSSHNRAGLASWNFDGEKFGELRFLNNNQAARRLKGFPNFSIRIVC